MDTDAPVPPDRPDRPGAGEATELTRTADEPPTLRAIGEAVHLGSSPDQGPALIRVRHLRDLAELEIGFHPLGGPLPHPLDQVVGFRAPPWWDAVGITSTGKVHHLDASAPSTHTVITSLTDRAGRWVSVIGAEGDEAQVVEHRPVGWSADVLRRILGLPTDPPEASPALLMDLSWLDSLATEVLGQPRRSRSWRSLARAHPLCPPGTTPAPEELAGLTANEALARPWWFLRERFADAPLPAADHGPTAEGEVLGLGRWFDDGSLCRWMLRNLPPADALLPDLLGALPDHLAEAVLAGLVEADAATAA